MPIKPLDRLLFAQGGRCFFCNAQLAREAASVEHLVAQVNGGTHADENCVACCKSINFLLGRLSVKEKIRIILNQKGKFVCPAVCPSACPTGIKAVTAVATITPQPNPPAPAAKPASPTKPASRAGLAKPASPTKPASPAMSASLAKAARPTKPASPAKPDNSAIVLTALKRRQQAMPKRIESLKNMIRSIVQGAHGSLTEPQVNALVERLRADGKIQINDTKVTYSL